MVTNLLVHAKQNILYLPDDDSAVGTLNFYGRLPILIPALVQLEIAGNGLNSIRLTED